MFLTMRGATAMIMGFGEEGKPVVLTSACQQLTTLYKVFGGYASKFSGASRRCK
jgi:hypothetical protein